MQEIMEDPTLEIRAMLAAATYVAPSGTEQSAFSAMVGHMLADGNKWFPREV